MGKAAVNEAPSEVMGSGRAARSPRRLHFGRAAVIGLCAGLLAVAFRRSLAVAEDGRGALLEALHAHPMWGWLVLPAMGAAVGCIVGWMTHRFAPEASGSGIPHLKGALLHLRRIRWERLLPVKFASGVMGIGVGLSLGREGPTVQMGSALALALAKPLRAPARDIPQLLSAGAGAGLAAAFNAPLAGLVFVIEELHRELSSRTAAGALVAAVCATVVAQWLAGDTPSFEVSGLSSMPLWTLPIAAVLGIVGGVAGTVFNRALLRGQAVALSVRRVPKWSMPGIAGAAAGLVGWWIPEAIGGGQGVAERLLNGSMSASVGFLALLIVAKLVMTVLSYGSGAPGGIFAPMLLLGALLGAALGSAATGLFPGLSSQAQALSVLGMAAMFVGSVRAPLTGIVLISEMTNGYHLLFPICVSSLAAYLAAEALGGAPIYDALLEADLTRSGHGPATPEPRSVYIGVQTGSAMAGRTIAQAGLPRGCLVTAVERGGSVVLPSAQTVLQPGDHITILTPGDQPEAPLEIVRLCSGL